MSIEVTLISLDTDSFDGPETKFFPTEELTLGREKSNDLILDRPEIANQHAVLRVERSGDGKEPTLYVTDLGSTTGTRIENVPLSAHIETLVRPNARVQIGNFLIKPRVIADADFDDTDESPEKEEIFFSRPKTNGVDSSKKGRAVDDSATGSFTLVHEGVAGDDLELEFSAIKLYCISGYINHKDSPLAGVTVDAGELGSTTSDQHGIFNFPNIPESTKYSISFRKAGYKIEPSSLSGTVDEDKDLAVAAKKLVALRGRVMHKGTPLSGVAVDANSLGSTTTDSEGYYEIRDIPEDTRYTISLAKDGYQFRQS